VSFVLGGIIHIFIYCDWEFIVWEFSWLGIGFISTRIFVFVLNVLEGRLVARNL